MSVYSELVNDSGTDPMALNELIRDKIMADPPSPWNLPSIDILDLWGAMNLRTAFGLLSGGETPTTYTRNMAKLVRAATGPTLLGFEEPVQEPDYTRALEVIETLRKRSHAWDAEVLD
jgi:hypothetical protein